jgi:hypothetical protein
MTATMQAGAQALALAGFEVWQPEPHGWHGARWAAPGLECWTTYRSADRRDDALNANRMPGETLSIGGNLPAGCCARLSQHDNRRIDRPHDPPTVVWWDAACWGTVPDGGVLTFSIRYWGEAGSERRARDVFERLSQAWTWARVCQIAEEYGCAPAPHILPAECAA